jgi:hypothetical protein
MSSNLELVKLLKDSLKVQSAITSQINQQKELIQSIDSLKEVLLKICDILSRS